MIFGLSSRKEKIERAFEVRFSKGNVYEARYKIDIMEEHQVLSSYNVYEIEKFTWGLIPFWSKTRQEHYYAKVSGTYERLKYHSLLTNPAFRMPIREQRCAILVDYFILKANDGTDYLVYNQSGNRPFAIGGLWDSWKAGILEEPSFRFCPLILPAPPEFVDVGIDYLPFTLHSGQVKKWINRTAPLVDVTGMIRTPTPRRIQCLSCEQLCRG
jgi:putative SOS response-associated peptidase YedK